MKTRIALVSLAVLLFSLVPPRPTEARLPDRPALLVQDFRNRSYELQYEWVGAGLAYLVRRNLTGIPGLEMLEDRRASPEDAEPIADFVLEGEIRLDEADARGERKFVVFVTLDRTGDATSRRQFLTEGTSAQLFDMAGYLTERIAKHVGRELDDAAKARLGHGMTSNLAAFQLFAEAIVERRIHAKIEGYEKAVTLDPRFAEAYFHLARVHTVLRDYPKAVEDFKHTIALVPDDAAAQNDYAYVLAQLGKTADAEAAYRTAVRLRPDEPKYHLNLGDVLRHDGKLEEARVEYEAALKLRPDDPEALEAVNVVDAKLGRPVTARASAPVPNATPARVAQAGGKTPEPRATPRPSSTPARAASVRATPRPVETAASKPTATPAKATPAPAKATPASQSPAGSPTPVETEGEAPPSATATAAARPADAARVAATGRDDVRELENARTAASRSRGDRAAASASVDAAGKTLEAGDRTGFYLALGRFYAGEKLNFAAVDALRAATLADPSNTAAFEALAGAYDAIGKKSDAAKARAAAQGGH